jgi:hypothetical protein
MGEERREAEKTQKIGAEAGVIRLRYVPVALRRRANDHAAPLPAGEPYRDAAHAAHVARDKSSRHGYLPGRRLCEGVNSKAP